MIVLPDPPEVRIPRDPVQEYDGLGALELIIHEGRKPLALSFSHGA
jgi:hypothetical protein